MHGVNFLNHALYIVYSINCFNLTLQKTDANLNEHVNQLKEEVRKMLLITADDDSTQMLQLIDAIQRLGVAYHFEKEIDEALKHMFDSSMIVSAEEKDDVYIASLRFRLLRQQGYNVSSGECSFLSYLQFYPQIGNLKSCCVM